MRHTNPRGEYMQCIGLLDADCTLKLAKHDVCNVHHIQPCYSDLVETLYRLLYYRPILLFTVITQL